MNDEYLNECECLKEFQKVTRIEKINLGIIYKCDQVIACKTVGKNGNDAFHQNNLIKRTRNEIEILEKLNHPNIINILTVKECEQNIHIYMPYYKHDLCDFIIDNGKLQNEVACLVAYKLANALKYCHKNNVIHGDIKAENVLLDIKNNRIVQAYLIDFNLSHNNVFCNLIDARHGTIGYIAPEVLSSNNKYCGYKADIWSFGVLVYTMLCGNTPFCNLSFYNTMDAIINNERNDYVPDVSEKAKDLIDKCMDRNPAQRPTMDEILDHPWFQTRSPGAHEPAMCLKSV